MADNNRLQIAELDFDTIKTNLKTYLQQQTEFLDYDFEGAGINVLINLLAYNTHYNAFYLNMVANESFLDTALLRDSVVSHAKTLGYVPYSSTAATAIVNVTVDSGTSTIDTATIPKGYIFLSRTIDNQSYIFTVMNTATVTKSGTNYYFENLEIKEGNLISYDFTQNDISNPKAIFELPESEIDMNTIKVSVVPSSGNTQTTVYNEVTEILDISDTSAVFFKQESRSGKYKIYFGDDVIGKKLNDGAVVTVTYLVTSGSTANKAYGFTAAGTINSSSAITVEDVSAAAGGSDREPISSIKYNSVSQFSTQNRLVTFKDYESYITKSYPSLSSISVWGGETEIPPVYGKVYISIKPKDDYYISDKEKERILKDIVNPKSIVSIASEFRDPEYLYILINSYVQYDPKKTNLTKGTLKTNIKDAILNYRDLYLNKFSSKFVTSKIQEFIDNSSVNSIIGSNITIRLEKRFLPTLTESKNYKIEFNAELRRGTIINKLRSTSFNVYDINGVERIVTLDEIPQSYSGITSIEVKNPGTGYTTTPTITITGDGTGAEATAVVVGGAIRSITITNRGIDYTRAIVTISGGNGYSASAAAIVDGSVGVLRTIYYDSDAQRQIVDSDVGTIDYTNGILDILDINILSVNSTDGYIRLSLESEKGIVETIRNTIITIDEDDVTSITSDLVESTF